MATKEQEMRSASALTNGMVPGRFSAQRNAWQVIVDLPDKPSIYRIFNSAPHDPSESGNSLLVFVEEPARRLRLPPGNSIDVLAKAIRVQAGTDGRSETAEGWYALLP
jgi:hypothetical protein